MEQSMSPGSQTFEQALFDLYKNGTITLEEALANADSANNLHWLINNAAAEQRMRQPAAPTRSADRIRHGRHPDYTKSVAPVSFSEFNLKMD